MCVSCIHRIVSLGLLQRIQAMMGGACVGVIVCKLEYDKQRRYKGYIAMLAVDESVRKRKIGECSS